VAILNSKTLADARNACEKLGAVDYDKPQINAALQAVEDLLTSNATKNQISSTINTATAPKTLSAAQKREIVKAVVVKLADRWV